MAKEKDTTKWEQKGGSRKVSSSEPEHKRRTGNDNAAGDSNLLKTILIVGAGLIITALAKGVRESEYYDNGKKDEKSDD